MTLVSVGPTFFPDPFRNSNSFSGLLLDAAPEKLAFIVDATEDGTLDGFEFCLGTVTQAPSAGLKVSFQDVSGANGDPDGVADQFCVVTAGLTSNAWVVTPGPLTSDGTAGGTKRTVTRGQRFACVIEFQSFNSGDSLNINCQVPGVLGMTLAMGSYVDHFTAAWAKQSTRTPNLALKYSNGTYARGIAYPAVTAIGSDSYSTASSPNEQALLFSSPVPMRVRGAWMWARAGTITADFAMNLYDTDGTTPLGTVALDGAMQASTAGGNQIGIFPADVTIAAGSVYTLGIKPTTVNAIISYYFNVNSAALMDVHEGGQALSYRERTGAGAWTDIPTRRPFMGLIVSALDDGLSPAPFVTSGLTLRTAAPPRLVVPNL